mgnify:CR=1 FL=1
MASTVFNGTNLVLKAIADGGTLATIGHTTSCSMSITQDLPDATSKDSAGYAENALTYSGTLTGTGALTISTNT